MITKPLPFDCSRCTGIIVIPTGERKECQSKETCRRYLSQGTGHERTPIFLFHPADDDKKCEDYWSNE